MKAAIACVKVDSYGGSLNYKVRFTLARGETEPVQKPDVVLVGNGQKLIYRRTSPTTPRITNEREIKFTEVSFESFFSLYKITQRPPFLDRDTSGKQ